jgi:hypothetical protein
MLIVGVHLQENEDNFVGPIEKRARHLEQNSILFSWIGFIENMGTDIIGGRQKAVKTITRTVIPAEKEENFLSRFNLF